MANCFYHSQASVKKWGGKVKDYQHIHDWMDESKKLTAHFAHRALRHHAEGCFAAEKEFGHTITNSNGKDIPVRLIVEKHIMEDLGFIPSFGDWIKNIKLTNWMVRGQHKL